ncbi:MAG TPA: glutamate 5-kinase [Chthoniobacteraceae bacterium]|nr:glutamate 5-kinase [Chthoniobacteraceae bacterium]
MAVKPKRIVLKFGSGILAQPDGSALDTAQFFRFGAEVSALVKAGHECIIVSSGAVAAGLKALGLAERPRDLPAIQACAAVGQSKLMELYAKAFATHRVNVAQLLLTHDDLDSRLRYHNAKSTLNRLLQTRNVVPIINENDSVAVEELKFGDNDRLSAEVAILAGADLLVLLTSVDGLLDKKRRLVPVVNDVRKVESLVRVEKGRFSVGGMASKLQAVKAAVEAGVQAAIANGRTPGQIQALVNGGRAGTLFPARPIPKN